MRLTIIIPRELVADFRRIAARRGNSVSSEVRAMMAETVERDRLTSRELFVQRARDRRRAA
jgi:hypothetical protein